MTKQRLWHRALPWLTAMVLAATFVAATIAGIALHLDSPQARRLAGRGAARALSTALKGRIEMAPIEQISLHGLRTAKAVLYDVHERRVVTLSGVRIGFDPVLILRGILSKTEVLAIVIQQIGVEKGEADIVTDPETGEPTIADAFTPRESDAPASAEPGSGRSLLLSLPNIEIGSVALHTTLRDVPPLEADLQHVHGQLVVGPEGIVVDVARFGAMVRGLGTEARGDGTLSVRAPGATRGTFVGLLGDLELDASAVIEGRHFELSATIPSALPAAVRRFLPDWPLGEKVSAHLESSGDLPELHTRAELTAGPAVASVEGAVFLGEKPHATLEFAGERLDARSFSARAPSTQVAVRGRIDAELMNGKVTARIRAHADPTEVEGYPVPAIDAEGTIREGALSGTADIHEPGMPAHATFRVGQGGVVDVDVDAQAVDLRQLRPVSRRGGAGRGGARLRAHLERGNLTASLEATTGVVEIASVRVSDARISVEARGPVEFPEKLQATAHVAAHSLSHANVALEKLTFDAQGNLAEAAFQAQVQQKEGPELELDGTLSLVRRPLVRNTSVSIKRDPVLIRGTIVEFDPSSATLYVRDIRTTGAGGRLTGLVRRGPNLVEVEAEGDDLDLHALSSAFPLGASLGGRAHVSLSLAASRNAARGRLRVGAADLTIDTIRGGSTEVSADLDDGRLTGGASGVIHGLGAFSASWNVGLSGSPLEFASLREATGTAELQLSDADLGGLDHFLPERSPAEKVEGRGYAKVELARANTHASLPSVKLTAVTRDLAVVLRGSAEEEGKRIAGIDLAVSGAFDGESGETSTNTMLLDAHGGLASFTGNVTIDVPRLVVEPESALAQFIDAPIAARASVPLRRLSDLPEILRVTGLDGDVSADFVVQGSLAHPTLRGGFEGHGLVVRGSSLPVDLHGEAQYDSGSSALRGHGEVKLAKETVATATLTGTLPVGAPSDLRGDFRLDLKGLPFDLIGALADNKVHGRVFGSATISRLAGGGALLADLRVADAVIDRTPLGEGKVHVATEGSIVDASVHFSGARGTFEAQGKAGFAWDGLLPSLSPQVPVRGRVVAKDFSLAPVSPLVAGVLSKVEGQLDANFNVALDPEVDEKQRVHWIGRADGSAVLQDGAALIELLGVDIHDVRLRVRADGKDNATHLSLADIQGRLRSAADNVHGSADFDFEGLTLVRGRASIDANAMPLLFHGAPQGRVTGNVALRLRRAPEHMLVDIDVPTLKLKLPEASSHNVIDVAEHPEIAILHSEPKVVSHGTVFPWKIPVHLGSAVSIQRSDVEVKITGTPVVHLGSETQVTGSIELVPGGRIPALGQVFAINRGLITFDTGVPENPSLDVRAEWRAPNNTLVFVQVTGRVKEVQVALRSDPPLPEREVFALLFGGASTDPRSATRATGDEGNAAKTAAMQGGVSQLNRLFGQSPVELRVGSTAESRPRYTAAVRVRENLWFEASTYKQSENATGSNTDQSVVSGTIDYRFSRKWSLRTELGTMGGALDLLWQYRY